MERVTSINPQQARYAESTPAMRNAGVIDEVCEAVGEAEHCLYFPFPNNADNFLARDKPARRFAIV
jgi:hypothetical protein